MESGSGGGGGGFPVKNKGKGGGLMGVGWGPAKEPASQCASFVELPFSDLPFSFSSNLVTQIQIQI